ncbi:retrovirus-related pol polyprotein from transposon TNT 1-94 [Tanacetum coccineum]
MMGNRKLFSTYKAYNGGNVIFGSNLRGNIIGKGRMSNDSLKIDNVEHVDNLRFNLLSIGKICDNKCRVTFSEHNSEITKDGKVIGRGIRNKGLYVMKLGNKPKDQIFLATIDENSTLLHRRLGHANMRLIQSLASKELVRNLPKLKFDQHFCDACKIGKQAHLSHKAKNIVSTTRCLELLYMDLFGPSVVRSYRGNRYTLVIVDDYSREFDNEVQFGEFCNANGITHNFSAPRTLQSNGMVERKNRTLQEMGYSQNSKSYIILNKHTRKVKELLNVTFDETPPPFKTSPLVDDDLDEEEAIKVTAKKNLENDIEDETLKIDEIVIMPHKSSDDYKNTRHYIPMISHEYRSPLKERLRNLESRYIHEGRVVFDDFADLNYVRSLFHFLEFECLLEINDQICPRFILEFYSQYQINYSDEGKMFIKFVIQNQFSSYSLEEFAQILDIPCEGACVFTNKWSLDELANGVHTDGPYQTNPLSPDDIISYIQIDREGQVRRIRHEEEINVHEYQILTREIVPTLKPLEEISWENVFCLVGNRDHVLVCVCYMLYCVANSEKFNLAYYMSKRMELVTRQPRLILPYGMLLTRLFKFVMSESSELSNEDYVLYDHVMNPLTAHQKQKTRKDRGTRRGRQSTSSSSAFDQPSSSHLNDDDDDEYGEGTSRASTPSPIHC